MLVHKHHISASRMARAALVHRGGAGQYHGFGVVPAHESAGPYDTPCVEASGSGLCGLGQRRG